MANTNSALLLIVAIVAVVLILIALIIAITARRKGSDQLRQKFGPEYDLAMEKSGDRKTAEETLKDREKRVNKLEIRPLNENERNRYHEEWTEIQTAFVDDPAKSVEEAHRLITEVMIARGFPVVEFEQRAADLSVFYPDFVTNYRNAYAISLKNQNGGSTTEEIRQAMVYYRSMFEELVDRDTANTVDAKEKKVITQ